ncbi:hypothetical protein [Acidovorax carolinensis]|nr:hypothetical protein [Acidovorax carolinensis]
MKSMKQDSADSMASLLCKVTVTGEPSCKSDSGIAGQYEFGVHLKRTVNPSALADAEKSEIACRVLDCFHSRIGIDVLDDFVIAVTLPNGQEITDDDTPGAALVGAVSYYT